MYDLPSEFPEEPGLPDEFHGLQPQLLSRTLSLTGYSRDRWFSGSDLNVYYDVQHPLWHKRPDWFLALDVPRLYDGRDLRHSYVVWQEGRSPAVVVEFLSPRTGRDDLGRFYTEKDLAETEEEELESADNKTTPGKLEVYERYLRVPHYIVHSPYTDRLRYFKLSGSEYEEQTSRSQNSAIWLEELQTGLGVWQGEFDGVTRSWLQWCEEAGTWLLTDTERAQQKAARTQQKAERLAERLRELGIDPELD